MGSLLTNTKLDNETRLLLCYDVFTIGFLRLFMDLLCCLSDRLHSVVSLLQVHSQDYSIDLKHNTLDTQTRPEISSVT